MASTCYCVKRPGLCGDPDYCSICPIDPDEPKTIKFTYEDSAYDSHAAWQKVIKATDTQIGGSHYKRNAIQPIDYIMANGLDFCEGNVVKYVSRWKHKGGIEDLKKARQYIDFIIEREQGK